jgi:hypothetical protein
MSVLFGRRLAAWRLTTAERDGYVPGSYIRDLTPEEIEAKFQYELAAIKRARNPKAINEFATASPEGRWMHPARVLRRSNA